MGSSQSKQTVFDDLADSNSVRLKHDKERLKKLGETCSFRPRQEVGAHLKPIDPIVSETPEGLMKRQSISCSEE